MGEIKLGTYKIMMGTYKMQVMHKFVLVEWHLVPASRGRRRTYLTILKKAWSADSKMVSSPVTSEYGYFRWR
jgi:hypothetical protein